MDVGAKDKGDVGRRLLHKALMPIVATAASAAATYAAKKAPQLLEDKVVPKLRDVVDGAGGVARDLPEKARAAAGDAGGVAERLTDRARSVAGGDGVGARNGRRSMSTQELERRLKERAKHRTERHKTRR